jgi:hypothetical protein
VFLVTESHLGHHALLSLDLETICVQKVQISGNSKLRPVRWMSEQIEEDNHFEICRPHSKKHVGYKKLLVCLKKYMIPLTKVCGTHSFTFLDQIPIFKVVCA